jgi:predicted Zn finger-like uncharacterized protein
MIIQCANCSKKFIVNDRDIPDKGRLVKCGFCSTTWHQKAAINTKPIEKKKKTESAINNDPVQNKTDDFIKTSSNIGINKQASDGKSYKYLGSQWAVILPSGKTGIFAKKKIAKELNKLIGIQEIKTTKKTLKDFDPSSDAINSKSNVPDIYKSKSGMGFFGYFFLIIILSLSTIGIIKTFEDYWLSYFPQDQYIFDLIDEQLVYVHETIKYIIIIIKDLTSSY